jgi:3,4-dihydroxy 2-butanone 4-phosphate synthase/GTP cyclohydrolase II
MSTRRTWSRSQDTLFRSVHGVFQLRAYEFPDGREHSVLIAGTPSGGVAPLVRVQSSCLTGTAFGALLCDCRPQLEESLRRVAAEGAGYVLYLAQEGRGYGLVEKVAQLSLITHGLATTANAAGEGRRPDLRDYEAAFAILSDFLGDNRSLRLLTNNPAKIEAFEHAGFQVERIALETEPTDENREYLKVKKRDMGHLLHKV